jgi:streptogramin lyase
LESRRLLTTLKEFALPSAGAGGNSPAGITAQPNGQVWFTETNSNQVDSISPNGTLWTPVRVGAKPEGIVYAGGEIWVAETGANAIGRIDPVTFQYTEFRVPTPGAQPVGLAYDPVNKLVYFTEDFSGAGGNGQIGYFNPATLSASVGITEKALPNASSTPQPMGITYNPADGNLWFVENGANQVGMFDPATGTFNSTPYSVPGASSHPGPEQITAGADGNLWFSESGTGTGSGLIDMFSPTSRAFAANGPYSLPAGANNPNGAILGITSGPDGDIYFTAGGVGQVGWFNPQAVAASGSNYGQEITVMNTPNAASAPDGIATGPDGNVWFTEQHGDVATGGNGAIGEAKLGVQLAVTTQPPSSVAAGGAFGLTAEVMYSTTGAVDPAFNGLVSVTLANNPGASTLNGTTTVAAIDGVAIFARLTLNRAGNGYALRVSGDGTSTTTGAFDVTTAPAPAPTSSPTTTPSSTPAPTVIAERLTAVSLKHNKKGKPIGKPVAEVALTFSNPMDTGTIDDAGRYLVAWKSTKKVRKRIQTVLHPVPVTFQPSDSSTTIVALVTSVPMQKFAKGGQVTIISPGSIRSTAGAPLGGATTFTI